MVLEFIDGPTMSIATLQSEATIWRVAESLRKLHAGSRFVNNFNMFRIMEGYLGTVKERDVSIPEHYWQEAPAVAKEIEAAVSTHPEPLVPCHNDLLAENFIDDGSMMRLPDCRRFADEHGLRLISIADLVRHRRRHEKLVHHFAAARVPTAHGEFMAHAYRSTLDDIEHVAYVMGDVDGGEPPLVRVHSECLTGDLLGSVRCDCGPQLQLALEKIAEEGRGVLVYLRGHEGRGIGIGHKIRAYSLQEQGYDTVDANTKLGLPVDSREYGIGAQILADLGAHKLRLMTNNPAKYGGIAGYGLEIVDRVPIATAETPETSAYLRTKRERMGHLLDPSN